MLTIFLLPVISAGVLRIGPIQDYAARKVAQYFSQELDTEITIGNLKLSYTGNLVLKDFNIKTPQGAQLASFNDFTANLNRFSINKKKVNIGLLKLSGAKLSFVKQDSVSSNLDFLTEYFSSEEEPAQSPYSIYCNRIVIESSRLKYKDLSGLKDTVNYKFNSFGLQASRFLSTTDTTGIMFNDLYFNSPGLFNVDHLTAGIGVSEQWMGIKQFKLKTDRSEMNFSTVLHYDSLAQLKRPFAHDISLKAEFENFAIIPAEFESIIPELKKLENTVFLEGNIKGKLKKPILRKLSFKALPYASFNVQGNITDVDSITDAYMEFDVDEVFLNPSASEKLVNKFTDNDFQLSSQIKNLGKINAHGNFRGKIDDFYSDAVFKTAAGDIVTDLEVWKKKSGKIAYKGEVKARDFDLGMVMDDNTYGYVGISAVLDGYGLDKYASANLDVTIDSVLINNRRYNNIGITGMYDREVFDGVVDIQSKRLKLTANGKANFRDTLPHYVALVKMPYANLKSMGVLDENYEGIPVVSTSIMLQMEGDNADNLHGWIRAKDTRWAKREEQIVMDSMKLKIDGEEEKNQKISLKSDYIDAQVSGHFSFSDLKKDMKYLISGGLPELAGEMDPVEQQQKKRKEHYLNFRVDVKKTKKITAMFMPQLRISPGTYIAGTFLPDQQKIELEGNSNYMLLGGLKFRDITLDEIPEQDLGLHLYADRIEIEDTIGIDRFNFKTRAVQDSMHFRVHWDDYSKEDLNKGDISGSFCLSDFPRYQLLFDQSYFKTNDTLWNIKSGRSIDFDSTSIAVDNFWLGNKYQSLNIDGSVSADSTDELLVHFNNLNISNIDPFTHPKKLDFDGKISGDFKAKDLYSKHPTFTSDLRIDSIGFNHKHLGDAIIQSGWVDTARALQAKVEILYKGNIGVSYPLKVEGLYYPRRDTSNFDFDLSLNKFKLQTLAGYLEGFTSYFRGYASGEMSFEGDLEDPELLGKIRLQRTVMKINYLNTIYSFTDTVKFRNNEIVFNDVAINDNNKVATRGNKAFLNGRISHENFKNLRLDLTIDVEDLTMLNTSYSTGEMYYGTAIASGKIDINGPTHDVKLDAVAKAKKGTKLYIPLSSTEEASQTDYISFIDHSDTAQNINFQQKRRENVKGLKMNFDMEVTPDAQVQIIFDERMGDVIKARGRGDLELSIDTRGEFSMYGNYEIQKGDYLFTLQDIINKPFDIEKGSSISWSGNPYDAKIDLDAVYNTEARLYDLVSYLDSSDIYKKRRPVNCVIHLSGDLMSPDIKPDIQLPDADEITRQLLKTTLYVNANQVNRQEMNRQFVGLLVLGSFFPPSNMSSTGGGSVGDYASIGGTINSTELISNQLSNWLSQISDDFNIGLDYQPGDEISSEKVKVALSTQLFDDKVSISTNVGVGGNEVNQQTTEEEETSNIVGDVNVEYKWTNKLRIRAFNRHNNTSYLEESGPYTQGVGVFFRREFDSFSELFRKNNEKAKEIKENQN